MNQTSVHPIEPDLPCQIGHRDVGALNDYCYNPRARTQITYETLLRIRDEVGLVLGLNVKLSEEGIYTSSDGRKWLGHITINRDNTRYRFYFPLLEDAVQHLCTIELHVEKSACTEERVIKSMCRLLIEASEHVFLE